jgi:hypothetical protein
VKNAAHCLAPSSAENIVHSSPGCEPERQHGTPSDIHIQKQLTPEEISARAAKVQLQRDSKELAEATLCPLT